MKRLIVFILVFVLSFQVVAYTQDVDIKPHDRTLLADLAIKPWNQLTLREKYGQITWNNHTYYAAGAAKISEALIDQKLGTATAVGIDELDQFKKYSIQCDVYSIRSVSQKCVVAVKFQGYKGYYRFVSHDYNPETLGDLIQDLNLKENLKFNKIYYSYWKNGVVASGNYVNMEYTLPDTSVVWDMLLSNTAVKNSGDEHYKNELMGISIDVEITGAKNIALSVNEDGYLQTNILGTGKSFFIGKKKVNEFVKYVKTHGKGKILVPDPNAKDIPE